MNENREYQISRQLAEAEARAARAHEDFHAAMHTGDVQKIMAARSWSVACRRRVHQLSQDGKP